MSRAGCCLVLLAVGCSRSPRAEDFVPPEAAARTALERALDAWVKGEPKLGVPGEGPTVAVADETRLKGRPLSKYEILGPTPGDAARCFAVRLTLGGPTQEVRERYVVLGLDPVWVWRYDDYVMLTHWDHAMPAPKPKR